MTVTKLRPTVSDDDDRAALAAAIILRNEARMGVKSAEQAAERAKVLLSDAQDQLAQYGDIEALCLARRTEMIKAGVDLTNTPSDLVARRHARDEAELNVAEAKAAVAALVAEVEASKRALLECEGQVRAAAITVMSERADALGGELAAVISRQRALERQLSALSDFVVPRLEGEPVIGRPELRQFPLPPTVRRALAMKFEGTGVHAPPISAVMAQQRPLQERWAAWYSALIENADAEIA